MISVRSLATQNSPEFWAEAYHSHFGEIPPHESAPEWLDVRVISRTRHETAFQLNVKHSPSVPRTICRQGEDNVWRVTDATLTIR